MELHALKYSEIWNFIFSLPIYGLDVTLERFRPNGDKYSSSKITESLIKIKLSQFYQRMDEMIKINQKDKKKKLKIFQRVLITLNHLNHQILIIIYFQPMNLLK